MSRYAAFFDIDGTLWDEKNNIPESTIDAIRQFRAKGNYAFICTGRHKAYVINPNLLNIGFDGIIAGCGTYVEFAKNIIYYKRISDDLGVHTVETVRKFGFKPILEGKDHLYFDDEDFADGPYGQKLIRELGANRAYICKDYGRWEFSKLSCDTTDCDVKACEEVLGMYYTFLPHTPSVLEMVPKGHSKATGIAKWCDQIHFDPMCTLAFGDGVNDIDMIRYAGCGIVMGNGQDAVKAEANYVTTDIHDDGVYNALRELNMI